MLTMLRGLKFRLPMVLLNRLTTLVPSSVPCSRPFTRNLVDRHLMVPAPLPITLRRAPNYVLRRQRWIISEEVMHMLVGAVRLMAMFRSHPSRLWTLLVNLVAAIGDPGVATLATLDLSLGPRPSRHHVMVRRLC